MPIKLDARHQWSVHLFVLDDDHHHVAFTYRDMWFYAEPTDEDREALRLIALEAEQKVRALVDKDVSRVQSESR